jgi:hypothetical protein
MSGEGFFPPDLPPGDNRLSITGEAMEAVVGAITVAMKSLPPSEAMGLLFALLHNTTEFESIDVIDDVRAYMTDADASKVEMAHAVKITCMGKVLSVASALRAKNGVKARELPGLEAAFNAVVRDRGWVTDSDEWVAIDSTGKRTSGRKQERIVDDFLAAMEQAFPSAPPPDWPPPVVTEGGENHEAQ